MSSFISGGEEYLLVQRSTGCTRRDKTGKTAFPTVAETATQAGQALRRTKPLMKHLNAEEPVRFWAH